MKQVIPLFAFAGVLLAQTAQFPTSLATDEDLLKQKDRSTSTLSAGIDASQLTVPVADGTKFVAYEVVTINDEQMLVCSINVNTLNICVGGRGFAGTTPATHTNGATVSGYIVAWAHNALSAEIKAIETALGAGFAWPLDLISGGTNQTTWTASRCVRVNAGGTALEAAAADCGTAGSHNLLSATHPDTVGASPVLGDLLFGNVTPAWTKLAGNISATLKVLSQTGTGAVSATPMWLEAVSTNTTDAIVRRDAGGNFGAGTVTAALNGNSSTATALAANPTDCAGGTYATGIDASGNLTCASTSTAIPTLGVVRTTAVRLTISGSCSSSDPCNVRFGNTNYQFTSSATADIVAGAGAGNAYIYVASDGTLTVGHNLGAAKVTCTGCTAINGITSFPTDSAPGYLWPSTVPEAWDAAVGTMDRRAWLSTKKVLAGSGITVSEASGHATIAADGAVVEMLANKNAASGYAGLDGSAKLAAGQLPNPGAAALGGVKSLTCSGTDKLSAIGTDALPVCSADQTGGIDPSTTHEEFDDFCSGSVSSDRVGRIGWAYAGGGALVFQAVASGEVCVLRMPTTAIAANVGYIYAPATADTWFNLADAFDITWRVKLVQIDADTEARVGASAALVDGQPTDGVYFERLGTDTNWFRVTRAASSETREDTGVAASTSWIKFRIRRDGANIGFSVNGGAESDIGTNIPTGGARIWAQVKTLATAAKSLDLDYMWSRVTGLSR